MMNYYFSTNFRINVIYILYVIKDLWIRPVTLLIVLGHFLGIQPPCKEKFSLEQKINILGRYEVNL